MSAFGRSATGIFPVLAGLLFVLAPGTVLALGLGEARVDSYLNQPLEIRIRLLDATELELDSLTVGPASATEYQRLGVGGSSLALALEFEIDRSTSPAMIRITSTRAVADPIVQLLVDARWSSGRLLREYTLFLDPPTLDIAPPPAPVRTEPAASLPTTERPVERPVERPITRLAEPPTAAEPASPPSARAVRTPDADQWSVRSGDTLWTIAQSSMPAGDISMNQMMVAIVELNPQAFRNGNIHQMLRGSELQLPDADRARNVDRTRATATVQAQNRAFNQRLAGDVPVISDAARDAIDAGRSAPAEPEPTAETPAVSDASMASREPEPEARLELVPSGEDEAASGLDEDGEEVSRLRQQLARTEEELFAARLEAEEFRSRLTELEALVEDNPGGLGIADADLAGLEQTLRAARLASAENADPALREDVTAQLDEYLTRFETMADGDDGALATEPPDDAELVDASAPDPATVEDAEPERVVTQVGGGERNWWSSPLLLPLAGLAVLLILIASVWFLLQRRRRETGTEGSADRGAKTSAERREPEAAVAVSGEGVEPADRARDRVAATPTDLTAHLALLTTLASDDDTEHFSGALEDMFEHVETGAEPAWREALELAGRIVPGHVLVKGSADWMSVGSEDSGRPMDELDEESEVGDLMSRLEAEPHDESDDRDWIEGSDGREGKSDSESESRHGDELLPSLHEEDDEGEPMSFGEFDDEESVEAEPEAQELTSPRDPVPGVEDDERDAGWLSDDRSGDDDDRGNTGDGVAETTGAANELEDEETMMMDWTDSSDDADSAAQTDDEEEDSDIFAPGDDDVDVKLDLARAYLSWNSTESATTLLEEVVREGNDEQKEQAQKLLDEL